MGVETEYAFAVFARDGLAVDRESALSRIERIAARSPHLPAMRQRGIFLANGSRFYRDFGGGDAHQELAIAECNNPWDVVRHTKAGERFLENWTGELLREDPQLTEALYFKHNVDYGGSRETWGTHESYQTRTEIEKLPKQLLPHLISRVIITGAGGFNSLVPGIEFMLSPRVAHLVHVVGPTSEYSRPIFHTRDEPLSSGGYHRLHIICGESLCSHTAMWLRSATTALILAMIDGGLTPGDAVSLACPLEAMRRFALDPTCKAVARTAQGRDLTAVQIQRAYLAMAEAHIGAPFMPPWGHLVIPPWRNMLDRLEQGAPGSVARTLDWAIKLALYQERVAQSGAQWDRLSRDAVPRSLQRLRQELFEVDVRFGQLGPKGIFSFLDRERHLDHAFDGVNNIEHAMENPPAIGRANLRGQIIRRLSGGNGRYACDWMGVWDLEERKFLDLSDPFEATEKWKPIPEIAEAAEAVPDRQLSPAERMLAECEQLYFAGRFEDAYRLVVELEAARDGLEDHQRRRLLRARAWVQCRRGWLDAMACLNELYQGDLSLGEIANYLLVLRFGGLTPRPEMEAWIQRGLNVCSRLELLPETFKEHWGNYLLAIGNATEAERVLDSAVRSVRGDHRLLSRTLAPLADAKRILGNRAEARELLEAARRMQTRLRLETDLADFTLPNQAKLIGNAEPDSARACLKEAKKIQERLGDRLGLARTLLLEARLGNGGVAARRRNAVLDLQRELPALAECRLLARILARWEAWTSDPGAAEHQDVFWGL